MTFSSHGTTAEFPKFAGILSAALSHVLGGEGGELSSVHRVGGEVGGPGGLQAGGMALV